jgi:NAD(P)-dependent dehydrogenase (short-subunit alcohol dehydrogenase family)
MSLEGKKVLITGAARRVGRALALALAAAGADLVIHYSQSQQEAEQTQADIEKLGRKAVILKADLENSQEAAQLVPRALEHGALFALVNNASIFEPLTWEKTSLQDWERNLRVNLTAPFLLCQAFARSLPAEATGRIVNLLDWRALRPGADHLPYTISKAGLAALTQSLAVALAPKVTVNGLALGAILPPSDGAATDKLIETIPARRWANLDEVAQALLFLLDGPAYLTGDILYIDGGRHLV